MAKDLIAEAKERKRKAGKDPKHNELLEVQKISKEHMVTGKDLISIYKVLRKADIFEKTLYPETPTIAESADLAEKIKKKDLSLFTEKELDLMQRQPRYEQFIKNDIFIDHLETVAEIVAIATKSTKDEVLELPEIEIKSMFTWRVLKSILGERLPD